MSGRTSLKQVHTGHGDGLAAGPLPAVTVGRVDAGHRKGATRAFPPGHPEIPKAYRDIGQPVLIPGDMGRGSWVLAGRPSAMDKTFGTTCHGAGRAMSRTASVKAARGRDIRAELAARGVVARSKGWKGLAEEQSDAYKDVDAVVEVVDRAGLSSKVGPAAPTGRHQGLTHPPRS